jgi:hypothetical protein
VNNLFGTLYKVLFLGYLRKVYFNAKIRSSHKRFSNKIDFSYRTYTDASVNPLTLLSEKFGSDKGSTQLQNPYPWKPHSYTLFYHHIFSHTRGNVKNVFECGIGSSDETIKSNMSATGATGASLKMWREYFPNARIFGADIDSKALFQDSRISTAQMDQTCKSSIEEYWKKLGDISFDLMIDDGLHSFSAGSTLFENSIHKLSQDGIYFIEDVNSFDLLKYQEYFSSQKYNVEYITLYHGVDEVSDDCIIKICN